MHWKEKNMLKAEIWFGEIVTRLVKNETHQFDDK